MHLEKNNATLVIQGNAFRERGLIQRLAAFFGIYEDRRKKKRIGKKDLAKALILAQKEERKRIYNEPDNGFGRSLLLVRKQLERDRVIILENQGLISETLVEVQGVSQALYPIQLEKLGLRAAIKEAIENKKQSADFMISSELEPIDQVVAKKAQISIYCTVREALNNLVQHAEASSAKVSAEIKGQEVRIEVRDNGIGFDHELAVVKGEGKGLKMMFEQINRIGGKLIIDSGGLNQGTLIEISIPKENV